MRYTCPILIPHNIVKERMQEMLNVYFALNSTKRHKSLAANVVVVAVVVKGPSVVIDSLPHQEKIIASEFIIVFDELSCK